MNKDIIEIKKPSSVLLYYIYKAFINSLFFIVPMTVLYIIYNYKYVGATYFVVPIILNAIFIGVVSFIVNLLINETLVCRLEFHDRHLFVCYYYFLFYKEIKVENNHLTLDIGKYKGMHVFTLYKNGILVIKQNVDGPWTMAAFKQIVSMMEGNSVRIDGLSDRIKEELLRN